MPVDSPEIRNEAQIVNLDSRTKRFVERKFAVMPLYRSAMVWTRVEKKEKKICLPKRMKTLTTE
jgi:hypothetical protein